MAGLFVDEKSLIICASFCRLDENCVKIPLISEVSSKTKAMVVLALENGKLSINFKKHEVIK